MAEMKKFWWPERIRYLKEASEFVGFNDILAERASAYMPQDGHVCDMGCGLGYLALSLSPYCRQVTGADCDPDVLAVLEENIGKKQLGNVDALCTDVFNMPSDIVYDAMVFCMFGSIYENLRLIRRHCRGKAVIFRKNWSFHTFAEKQVRLNKLLLTEDLEFLKRMGISYICNTFEIDMGQPFRSMEDAVAFFKMYSKGDASAITEADVKDKVMRTWNDEFPYYMRVNRSMGMIVIDAKDISFDKPGFLDGAEALIR